MDLFFVVLQNHVVIMAINGKTSWSNDVMRLLAATTSITESECNIATDSMMEVLWCYPSNGTWVETPSWKLLPDLRTPTPMQTQMTSKQFCVAHSENVPFIFLTLFTLGYVQKCLLLLIYTWCCTSLLLLSFF